MSDEEEEEGGGEGGWLVSYADLMTLLFASFVVLYGITPQGKSNQILGIASSIREAFIEIPDETPEEIRKNELYLGKLSFIAAKRDSTINPAIKKFNRKENPLKGRNQQLAEVEVFLEKIGQGEGIHQSLRKSTDFAKDEFGFSLSIAGKPYFKKDSITMTNEGRQVVIKVARQLATSSIKLMVAGHVSRSTRSSPIELAARRAGLVAKLLSDNGVLSQRISTASYGDLRPISKKNSQKNDRVEISIKKYKKTR